jgi:hypothetical protein
LQHLLRLRRLWVLSVDWMDEKQKASDGEKRAELRSGHALVIE